MQRGTDYVEEASIQSFPASDPPAWTPVMGEREPGQQAQEPYEQRLPQAGADQEPAGTNTGGGAAESQYVSGVEDELSSVKDQLLRALAEQENIRRRATRERDDTLRLASAGLARDVLPTLDNLRRAIESIAEDDPDPLLRSLLTGLTAIERSLLSALEKHGINRISASPGEPFDPNWHEAVSVIEGVPHPAGTVVQVLQPGYQLHERLLRPAIVSVSGSGGADRD